MPRTIQHVITLSLVCYNGAKATGLKLHVAIDIIENSAPNSPMVVSGNSNHCNHYKQCEYQTSIIVQSTVQLYMIFFFPIKLKQKKCDMIIQAFINNITYL